MKSRKYMSNNKMTVRLFQKERTVAIDTVRMLRIESTYRTDCKFVCYGRFWMIVLLTILFICVPLYLHASMKVIHVNDSIDIKNRMAIQDYVEKAVAAQPKRDKKLLAEFWSVAAPNTLQSSQDRWVCGTYNRKIPTYWDTTLRRPASQS